MGSGYFTVGRWRGVPIRFHFTVPIFALIFSGFRFAPGYWIAFFGLILIHELGHAVVVKWARAHVISIDVLGFGGLCRWSGGVSSLHRAMIAWGGIWAQMLLYAGAMLSYSLIGPPQTGFGLQIHDVLTRANLWIMMINLLPVRPLDGAEAWPLFRILWERWRFKKQVKDELKPVPKNGADVIPFPQKPDPEAQKKAEETDRIFNKMLDGVLNGPESPPSKKDDET